MLKEIVETFQISETNLKAIYVFGSRFYGIFSKNSDFDLFIIYEKPKILKSNNSKYEITFLTEK